MSDGPTTTTPGGEEVPLVDVLALALRVVRADIAMKPDIYSENTRAIVADAFRRYNEWAASAPEG